MVRHQPLCASLEDIGQQCLVWLHEQWRVYVLGIQNQGCSELSWCKMGEHHQKHLRVIIGLILNFFVCLFAAHSATFYHYQRFYTLCFQLYDHEWSGNPQCVKPDLKGDEKKFLKHKFNVK